MSLRFFLMGCATLLLLFFPGGKLLETARGGSGALGPILLASRTLDAQTVIAPSAIPNSGNGLFARVRFREGEVIGEIGGQLIEEIDVENPNGYLVGLDDCAFMRIPPYRYIDSRNHGGHVSRINFAPRTINGRETNFQNAAIRRLCEAPYVVFVALKDIEPGTEIWASYGPHYPYDRFMYEPAVREFFCNQAKIDCRENYSFEP